MNSLRDELDKIIPAHPDRTESHTVSQVQAFIMQLLHEQGELIWVNFIEIFQTPKHERMPKSVLAMHIASIDYGNYGTENDRHYEPALRDVDYGTPRPVAVIKMKDGKQYWSESKLEFSKF